MAKASTRSSANTDLFIGTLRAHVGLFGTKVDPAKLAKFDSAGPNGGRLKYEQRAIASPVGEDVEQQDDAPVRSDPLADVEAGPTPPITPDFDAPPIPTDCGRPASSALVDGEFRQVLVEDGSGEVVEADAVRRGVFAPAPDGSERFVDLTDQVEAITSRTKLDRIEVVATIDSTQVRRERVVGAYYLGAQEVPKDATDPETYVPAAAAMRMLFEALRRRREVAVVKYTTRSRQQLGVIMPHAKTGTLVLLSLVFHEDFRVPPPRALAIAKAQVSEGAVSMMEEFCEAIHDTVDALDELRDDAVALREELMARAEAGEMDVQVVEALPEPEAAPDLMETMQASIAAAQARRAGKV